jgi:hypothetical protein
MHATCCNRCNTPEATLVCKATGAADAGVTSAAASVSYALYAGLASPGISVHDSVHCHRKLREPRASSCLCVNMQDICMHIYIYTHTHTHTCVCVCVCV